MRPIVLPKRVCRRMDVAVEARCGWVCYRLSPRGAAVTSHALYLHGGGYVAEIAPIQWHAVAEIAQAANAEITVPIYPLAPIGTAESVIATAVAITAQVSSERPSGIQLLGDSAGGGMALAVAQQLYSQSLPQPRRLILIAPWLDITLVDPAVARIARTDAMLDVPGLIEAGRMYAGELAAEDPRVSPIRGELAGLPPISLFSGTADLVHPDSRALVERAAAEGIDIDYHECERGQHCYPLLPTREGRQARRVIAALLRA
ncbi:alpha/beta hydrolase fold domain-containing protein [Nocardia fluminea]|uniref:alpha/beta hydrolase fold domain-containing protein n=1 Tax=Nocardia fluminea TaxID=134984 RepID=UPI00365DA8D6